MSQVAEAVKIAGQEQEQKDALTAILDNKTTIAGVRTLAALTDGEQVVFIAPKAVTITALSIAFEGAVTANATNYLTLSIVNKSDTDKVVGTAHAFDTVTTDDLAAYARLVFALTAANVALAVGAVLALKSVNTGTSGLALPVGAVQVTYQET